MTVEATFASLTVLPGSPGYREATAVYDLSALHATGRGGDRGLGQLGRRRWSRGPDPGAWMSR